MIQSFKLLEMHLLTTSERISAMAVSTYLETLLSISQSGSSTWFSLVLLSSSHLQSQLLSRLALWEASMGLHSQSAAMFSLCWSKPQSAQPLSSKSWHTSKHSYCTSQVLVSRLPLKENDALLSTFLSASWLFSKQLVVISAVVVWSAYWGMVCSVFPYSTVYEILLWGTFLIPS